MQSERQKEEKKEFQTLPKNMPLMHDAQMP